MKKEINSRLFLGIFIVLIIVGFVGVVLVASEDKPVEEIISPYSEFGWDKWSIEQRAEFIGKLDEKTLVSFSDMNPVLKPEHIKIRNEIFKEKYKLDNVDLGRLTLSYDETLKKIVVDGKTPINIYNDPSTGLGLESLTHEFETKDGKTTAYLVYKNKAYVDGVGEAQEDGRIIKIKVGEPFFIDRVDTFSGKSFGLYYNLQSDVSSQNVYLGDVSRGNSGEIIVNGIDQKISIGLGAYFYQDSPGVYGSEDKGQVGKYVYNTPNKPLADSGVSFFIDKNGEVKTSYYDSTILLGNFDNQGNFKIKSTLTIEGQEGRTIVDSKADSVENLGGEADIQVFHGQSNGKSIEGAMSIYNSGKDNINVWYFDKDIKGFSVYQPEKTKDNQPVGIVALYYQSADTVKGITYETMTFDSATEFARIKIQRSGLSGRIVTTLPIAEAPQLVAAQVNTLPPPMPNPKLEGKTEIDTTPNSKLTPEEKTFAETAIAITKTPEEPSGGTSRGIGMSVSTQENYVKVYEKAPSEGVQVVKESILDKLSGNPVSPGKLVGEQDYLNVGIKPGLYTDSMRAILPEEAKIPFIVSRAVVASAPQSIPGVSEKVKLQVSNGATYNFNGQTIHPIIGTYNNKNYYFYGKGWEAVPSSWKKQ